MQRGPFQHQHQRPAAHRAIHDSKGFDINLNIFALINGVKMGRRVVAVKHADYYAVKPAQFRHGGRLVGFRWRASAVQRHEHDFKQRGHGYPRRMRRDRPAPDDSVAFLPVSALDFPRKRKRIHTLLGGENSPERSISRFEPLNHLMGGAPSTGSARSHRFSRRAESVLGAPVHGEDRGEAERLRTSLKMNVENAGWQKSPSPRPSPHRMGRGWPIGRVRGLRFRQTF